MSLSPTKKRVHGDNQSSPSSSLSLSSLPDDAILRCLLGVPRSSHLNVSHVNKTFRSLVRSPEFEFHQIRSLLLHKTPSMSPSRMETLAVSSNGSLSVPLRLRMKRGRRLSTDWSHSQFRSLVMVMHFFLHVSSPLGQRSTSLAATPKKTPTPPRISGFLTLVPET
ncbi:unnamed protein product [Microthlaspi erraticum]|uniref:F-box domain-containing protein n=1 Tax=Microthlaspi erraticum TaxID=1685480 RepID=A0A6D2HWQ5_9BRAS|nr:unnamed protein product [Microthlaspi erraticum]